MHNAFHGEKPLSDRGDIRSVRCPIILIAGTGSGVGKTSVTLGLVRALVRMGRSVQPFKVGPDYLDPTYLGIAAGRPCYNVDTWMCPEAYITALIADKSADCDVIVVEGAMGLFDGAGPSSSRGSAAEVARLLNAKVVLVCDARGQARSLAATVKGFSTFEPGVTIACVVANLCGSEGHARLLAEALEAEALPPLIGGIEKGALPTLKSRHLGLFTAKATAEMETTLERLADVFSSRVSIARLFELSSPIGTQKTEPNQFVRPYRSNSGKGGAPERPRTGMSDPCPAGPEGILPSRSIHPSGLSPDVRLGIADDAAFHFYYPDNLEAFEAHGFELVRFSPISDVTLPDNLDALYLGGGYPELAAEALAANLPMLASVREFSAMGRPLYAECGGLMYLSEGIVTADDKKYAMAGVLPGICRMQGRLAALGYADVILTQPSLFGERGTRIRGHIFHYSALDGSPLTHPGWTSAYDIVPQRNAATRREGYQYGNTLISYVHLHLASHETAIAHFREVCARTVPAERRQRRCQP